MLIEGEGGFDYFFNNTGRFNISHGMDIDQIEKEGK